MFLRTGIAAIALAITLTSTSDKRAGAAPAADAALLSPAVEAFRDSVDTAPPGWSGPKFKLSHNYPKRLPVCQAPWLKRMVSFDNPSPKWEEWKGYVQDIVDYVKEGQEANLPDESGWKVDVNGATRWYHVPWMAYDGERGREFIHGLTNELSTALSTFREGGRGSGKAHLAGIQNVAGEDPLFETWSVGMYNPCGGYSLGQAFPASGEPAVYSDSERTFARGMPFADGTVVMKILNTTADETNVSYLKGSTTWQANGHVQLSPTTYSECERRPRKVHLIQIDLAVVDSRSPTRWVYSTLAYNGFLPGSTVWDRLEPLGVQWGNDHKTFPAVPKPQSGPLWETVSAPVDHSQLPEHYGCEKRLAGAVDQSNSSCVSCHMGAYAAAPPTLDIQGETVPAIFNFPGMCTDHNTANEAYFSDYKYPARYPSTGNSPNSYQGAIPLDSSLQLAVSFAQYAVYRNPNALPPVCPDPRGGKSIVRK